MLPNYFGRTALSVLSRRTTFLKAAGYRILSVVVTVVVAFVVLRDASAAIDVGIWANVLKTGVYYGYERAWSDFEVGRVLATVTAE